jgi:hypothetical protein
MNPALVVFDSIPAAIPLLFDISVGTLARCPETLDLQLELVASDEQVRELPSDEEILSAWSDEGRTDLCAQYAMIAAPEQSEPSRTRELAPTAEIIVTNGPISTPYEILGPVQVDESDFEEAEIEPTLANLDRLLRLKALKLYGKRVDAIINVGDQLSGQGLSYSFLRGLHDRPGVPFARGLAVEFIQGATRDGTESTHTPTAAERLRVLKGLLDDGLISPEEYERKRAAIVELL